MLRHYHARVATWLIGRGMERVGQIAGLIAEHFARAGETQRTVKWYGLAGRQARDTYAPEAAIDYFQTALSLLPYESDDIEQRMALMEGVGRSLQAIGQYAAAAVVYRDLAWVAGAEGHLPAQARALSRLATVQDRQGQPTVALETSRTAVSLAEEAGDEGRTEFITALLVKPQPASVSAIWKPPSTFVPAPMKSASPSKPRTNRLCPQFNRRGAFHIGPLCPSHAGF